MISGIGGFSAYPPIQGGYFPPQQGVAGSEQQKQNEQGNSQILGTESGQQEKNQVDQTQKSETSPNQEQNQNANTGAKDENKQLSEEEKSASGEELSEDEKKEVQELKKRDAEVRAHEQAHLAAAGSLSQGGASFEYQSGPDGGRYAVGGEVSIDTSKVANDPAATIAKAQRIRRAANAPAEPSSTDRSVAASAAAMEAEARKELAAESKKELETEDGNGNSAHTSSATEFYKNIQGSSASQGTSSLDIFA